MAGPGIDNRAPIWSRFGDRRSLAATRAWTDRPYRAAIWVSVSPRCTMCTRALLVTTEPGDQTSGDQAPPPVGISSTWLM